MTGNFQIREVPITSPFIRFCMLASSGLVREAMQLTRLLHSDPGTDHSSVEHSSRLSSKPESSSVKARQQPYRDLFAQAAHVLSELGHAKAALELPYLPDALKFELALKHHLEVPMSPQLFGDLTSIRRLCLANKQNRAFLESFYAILTQHNRHAEALEVATIANHPRQMLKSLAYVNCGRAAILARRLKDKALEAKMMEAVARQTESEELDLTLG